MDKDYGKLTQYAIKAKQGMMQGSTRARDEYTRLVREQKNTHDERMRDYKKQSGLMYWNAEKENINSYKSVAYKLFPVFFAEKYFLAYSLLNMKLKLD